MAAAGRSCMDIIRVSRSVAAESVGLGHMNGSPGAGKEADMVVEDQGPLKDFRALRTMRMVMLGGKRVV